MINIVIPMAGAGSRFAKAGYTDPKPLIDVSGRLMIELVIENLTPSSDHRFIFICQYEHIDKYGLRERLEGLAPGSLVIGINGLTQGAACTVLECRQYIDDNNPLMIANSDQWLDVDIDDYLQSMTGEGLIMTMLADDDKWSFVQFDEDGNPVSVVEKQVVSNCATVGVYNFKHGRDFCRYADVMIAKNETVNGEFYVAPVYKNLIHDGGSVELFSVGENRNGMYGLGVPEDLDYFLSRADLLKRLGLDN